MKTYEILVDIMEDGGWSETSLEVQLDSSSGVSIDTQAWKAVSEICQKNGIIFRPDSIEVITE
jgi:hypothetical protein